MWKLDFIKISVSSRERECISKVQEKYLNEVWYLETKTKGKLGALIFE